MGRFGPDFPLRLAKSFWPAGDISRFHYGERGDSLLLESRFPLQLLASVEPPAFDPVRNGRAALPLARARAGELCAVVLRRRSSAFIGDRHEAQFRAARARLSGR